MKHTLIVKNLNVSLGEKKILENVSLTINSGEIHALMGPNGSGKSTFSLALAGHPSYTINSKSSAKIDKNNLLKLKPEERAKLGLFIGFQQPVAVPGVRVLNFMRLAKNNIDKAQKNAQTQSVKQFKEQLDGSAQQLSVASEFLKRYLNDGFSGGEKKKMEMLQALTLQPKFAIFDEIDTGLDIDALKIVATAIAHLAKNGTGILIITHYQRILKYLKLQKIHLLTGGKIVKVGDAKLAALLEEKGYEKYIKE